MATAVEVTEMVIAGGALVSALTPIILERLKKRREQDSTVLASFTALNSALGREIERLQGDMNRMRDEYERRLTAAQTKIDELESEIATLNRLLSRRDT